MRGPTARRAVWLFGFRRVRAAVPWSLDSSFAQTTKPLACFGAFDLAGVLDGLGGWDAQECAVLTADRMDTVNEVNNVRRQYSQYSHSSQY